MPTRLPRPKKTIMGYHPYTPVKVRHKALLKKVKKESSLSVGRHLLLLSTFTKRTIPKASRIYKKNSVWVFKLRTGTPSSSSRGPRRRLPHRRPVRKTETREAAGARKP